MYEFDVSRPGWWADFDPDVEATIGDAECLGQSWGDP